MTLGSLMRPSRSDPAGLLVLLHGRGADERDLYPLFDLLDPEGRLVGVTPRGPLSLPPGGAHWYRVLQVGYPDPSTFHPTFRQLRSWFDALLAELGIGIERAVLGGFSQGAVMSYGLALGRGRRRPAGLIAMSGFIPTVEEFTLDLHDLSGWPVMIGHGSLDPVIGVDWGRNAHELLRTAGAEVVYRESAMGHTIDPQFLEDGRAWLQEVLP